MTRCREVIAAFAIAMAVLASACSGSSIDTAAHEKGLVRLPALAADGNASPVPTPTPTPTRDPNWSLTIAAGGDVMLDRGVAGSISEEDPSAPFAGVRDVLAAADIALVNLECAVSDLGSPEPKAYTFRAPPLAARSVAFAGIDAVALANNHALDYGPAALLDTIDRLGAEGVAAAGAGPDLEAALRPAILERGGVRVAILSFADVPSEAGYDMRAWEAGRGRPGIAWATPEAVRASVEAAAESADAVIVMFHYGAEYGSEPLEAQRGISRIAIDAGAVLVIGSHPHVLQEVEEYGGGLIAYSLGNFVFDGFDGRSNETAILRVTLTPAGIGGWELLPAFIGYDGLPRLE
jgi:poly-gamma-glutamate capsule biosynthesis protein CapA/YwtB (metallophosphatase superfamily)